MTFHKFRLPAYNRVLERRLAAAKHPARVVVVEGDAIAVRPMAYMSLTFDHRILDGAVADRFMAVIKRTLEAWQ